jgi:truncated hemoglobin YjbI
VQKAFDDFISGTMKMTDNKTVRRILHFKFTLPSADNVQFLSAMKNAAPHAAIFGDMKIRFLQNADNPAKIIQIVEYDAPESIEG